MIREGQATCSRGLDILKFLWEKKVVMVGYNLGRNSNFMSALAFLVVCPRHLP